MKMDADQYAVQFINDNNIPIPTDSRTYRALVSMIERAVQAEREACAKRARKAILSVRTDTQKARDMTLAELREECDDRAAAAIRARADEQRENTKGE
jgi:hypothetical protein